MSTKSNAVFSGTANGGPEGSRKCRQVEARTARNCWNLEDALEEALEMNRA